MAVGHRETFAFAHLPDLVFENLLGLLSLMGFDIRKADLSIRAVTACGSNARVAARVDAAGDGAVMDIECRPAYIPVRDFFGTYRKTVHRIRDHLQTSLES